MTGSADTSVVRSWWESLRADPIPWLLEGDDPGLSWRVLVELVGRPEDSPAVSRERSGVNAADPVASLLAPLHPDGTWAGLPDPWASGGGGWRVVSAVQLGADATDPRLQAASEKLLEETPGDGGFATHAGEAASPCLTARFVQALTSLGWARHLRSQEAMAWLEETGTGGAEGGWKCDVSGHGVNGGGCTVAAVALLAASADLPPGRRESLGRVASAVVLEALEGLMSPELQGWTLPGHPNLNRTDLVEVLWALARAGVEYDPRMASALHSLQRAQDELGRWHRSERAPIAAAVEIRVGQPSRWITLKAVRALREYAEAVPLPRLFPKRPR